METGPSGVILLTQIISQPHSSASSAPPRPLRKFYQGEPLALGITQILTGIVQVALGIILTLAKDHVLTAIQVGTPFWTGILYILSGIICVEAAKIPKISLVKGMLAMNTLSAIVAGVGIVIYSLSLIFYYPRGTCYWIEESQSCAPTSRVSTDTMHGVAMILLVFTILEFCVSISSAAFGCKTLCRDSYSDTSVVIYQNMGPPAALANDPPKAPPPYQDTQTPGSAMATTVTAGPITINNSFITQPHTASAASPARPQPLEKFYKGEPLALGITQILVGAVQVAVGVIMAMANSYLWIVALSVYVPIWSGLLYIISGSLSVAAAKNPKIPLVKGSLGMNIISSVLAGCAVILYLVSLLESRYQSTCDWYPGECTTYKGAMAFMVVLLLFTFLEFCVSISTAAFGCKTICRNSYSEVSVVIYQNVVPADDPTAATNTRIDAVACTPPPYKDLATP
ncbi:uncharacterized protein RBU57_016769 [Macrochelys suwanniensis]